MGLSGERGETNLTLRIAAVSLLGLCLGVSVGSAQISSFGQNKIQYTDFDWQVVESEHFELYYYPEEDTLALTALRMAEEGYDFIASRFRHEVVRKIPLIIYSTHQDFQQTNVSWGFLPEGVGGFTEFLKGRVALPFNGNYRDFERVIHHELVHVFQLSRIGELYRLHYRNGFVGPPLWFTEGMAEVWSGPWDSTGELFVRDLVLGEMMPDIQELWRYSGTFVIYKIGQHLVDYLERTYGPDVVAAIYEELWRVKSFEEALVRVTERPLRTLNAQWHHDLQQRYFPHVEDYKPLELEAQPLAVKSGANFQAAVPPPDAVVDPHTFYFTSPRSGYMDIYRGSTKGREMEVERLIKGGRSARYEALHGFHSGPAVSREGMMAFVSKYHERDALFLYNLHTEEVEDHWSFQELISLADPTFSPDGRSVAFTGLAREGRQDIYVFDLDTETLRWVTRDRYDDRDAAWSPDGETLAFVSDRNPWGEKGALNVYLYTLATGEITPLTHGPWKDGEPVWSPDGTRLAYASDRSGVTQLFVADSTLRSVQVTDFLGGAMSPAWGNDDRHLLFTGMAEAQWGIYRIPIDARSDTLAAPPAVADPMLASASDPGLLRDARLHPAWTWNVGSDTLIARQKDYRTHFTFDLAAGGFAFDPSQGVGQGLQVMLSDQLGDKVILGTIGNTAQDFGTILSRFNAGVTYWDQRRRLDTGFSAFHFAGDFYDEVGFTYFERRVGGTFNASYPFSRFSRVTLYSGFMYSERGPDSFRPGREGWLAVNYVSFVKDNTLWNGTGPIDGGRYLFAIGANADIQTVQVENVQGVLDLRRYFRLGRRSTYAVRLQALAAEGPLAQRFAMGGSWSFRGYPRRAFVGTRSLLLNQEVRFPLLNGVVLGLPMGPFGLPQIQGALFFDVGQAWTRTYTPPNVLGSYGVSFRTGLGFLVLRLDVSKLTDFHRTLPGTDVDFFVGFNY